MESENALRRQNLRRIVTVAALAAAALSGTTAAASAVPAGGHVVPNVAGCGIQVQDPHNSTHVPGAVNVVATVSCSSSVSHIALFVTLWKNGAVDGAGAVDVYFTNRASTNAAGPCQVLAYYAATAQAEIWFPTGPPQWTNVVNSPTFLWSGCVTGSA